METFKTPSDTFKPPTKGIKFIYYLPFAWAGNHFPISYYIYIYIRTCTCKQQWISKTNQFLLVGHSGMIFSKKNTERSPNHLSNNSAKNTKLFSLLFFWNIKKIWDREKVRGVTSARKNPWIQILDSWFTFSNFSPQVEFPTMRRKSVSIFRSTTPGEVRNGGWFQRFELLLWVSWDFVNVAFGGKVVTPQGWSAFANILYVYRSIYKYIYIAYIPAVPNHLHPKKLT